MQLLVMKTLDIIEITQNGLIEKRTGRKIISPLDISGEDKYGVWKILPVGIIFTDKRSRFTHVPQVNNRFNLCIGSTGDTSPSPHINIIIYIFL